MRNFLKNQKGVTMMEVLITVAILAIVVAPCLSAFVMAQRGNVKAKQTFETYTAAANLMEELKSEETPFPESSDSGKLVDEENQITAFYDLDAGGYYIVTIYAGVFEENLPGTDVEPILKGVITQ